MTSATGVPAASASGPWWRHLNRYHWFVFAIAVFGWLFDCFDQQIFTMSRSITMRDLLPHADDLTQVQYGGYATSIFIYGWATGGLIFGMLGDRWGRAKTMGLTILVYAACTGSSGMAQDWGWFAVFRFLTGAGVGGEFAVGAALVAEVMPDRARPHALGSLQALSAVGNILAAVSLGVVVPSDKLGWGWRGLYYLGAVPGLLAVFIFWRLKEPERWVAAKAAAAKAQATHGFGRLGDLFKNPRWRRNALVGLGLAVAGQIALWGAAFYTPELIDSAVPTVEKKTRPKVEALLNTDSAAAHMAALQTFDPKETKELAKLLERLIPSNEKFDARLALATPLTVAQKERLRAMLGRAITVDEKTKWKSRGGILQQIGSFFGIFFFTGLTTRLGRRLAFLLSFLFAWAVLILTFLVFDRPGQIWYLWPLLGFASLAPFGGYAIYFPELFPTRLRTTGTSFCYNVGRFVTGTGVFFLGPLASSLQSLTPMPGFRLAAMVLASSYFLGLIALVWAPETLNQPLPEDQPLTDVPVAEPPRPVENTGSKL